MKCQSASNVNKGGVMTLLNINNNRKLLVAMKCHKSMFAEVISRKDLQSLNFTVHKK